MGNSAHQTQEETSRNDFNLPNPISFAQNEIPTTAFHFLFLCSVSVINYSFPYAQISL